MKLRASLKSRFQKSSLIRQIAPIPSNGHQGFLVEKAETQLNFLVVRTNSVHSSEELFHISRSLKLWVRLKHCQQTLCEPLLRLSPTKRVF